MKVFPDTTLLAAAVATRGLAADLLRHLMAAHEVLVGEVVLVELREWLAGRLGAPAAVVAELEGMLRTHTVVARPDAPLEVAASAGGRGRQSQSRGWILASAALGQADVVLSLDPGLLAVGDEGPVAVVGPREFWDLVRRRS